MGMIVERKFMFVPFSLLDSNPVNFVFETLYVPVNWTESWILISSDIWILQTNGSDFSHTSDLESVRTKTALDLFERDHTRSSPTT